MVWELLVKDRVVQSILGPVNEYCIGPLSQVDQGLEGPGVL